MDKIWVEYDVNNSGVLEKEELKEFVKAFMAKHGHPDAVDAVDAQFGMVFDMFDDNRNGKIEKAEIHKFLKEFQKSEEGQPSESQVQPKESLAASEPS